MLDLMGLELQTVVSTVCVLGVGWVGWKERLVFTTELPLQLCLGTFTPAQTLGSECARPACKAGRMAHARGEQDQKAVCDTLTVLLKALAGLRPGRGGRRSFLMPLSTFLET